jgi:hypothetical protein
MKSFLDLAQAGGVLSRVARGTRWSLGQAKRLVDDAEQRLRSAAPLPPPTLAPLTPQTLPPPPVSPLSARVVRLRLATGLKPRVAVHADVQRLREHVAATDTQSYQMLLKHARTIDELARRQSSMQSKLDDLQAQCDLALVGGLRGAAATEARLDLGEQRLESQEGALKQAQIGTQRALDLQESTQRAQALNTAIGSAQAAAFGERGSLLATNNLTIAANQLLWGLVDPLLRRLGWWSGSTLHPSAWLGPLLGGAATQAVLTRYPYTDRISGVFVLPARVAPPARSDVARISLQERVPAAIWEDFKRRDDVVASATVVTEQDDEGDVQVVALVREGTLFLDPTGLASKPLKVVWTVDISVPVS